MLDLVPDHIVPIDLQVFYKGFLESCKADLSTSVCKILLVTVVVVLVVLVDGNVRQMNVFVRFISRI